MTTSTASANVPWFLRIFKLRTKPTSSARDKPSPAPRSSPSLSLRELESTAPRRALRLTLGALVALVASLIVWSLLAQLDIVVTAPGKLVPVSQVKRVQAAESGIVREILVRDGDAVTAGQVLIRMDPTLAAADSTQVGNDLALKRITVRTIDALLAAREAPMQRDDPPSLYAQVQSQYRARAQALADSVAQESQAAERANHERRAALQVRDKLRESLPTYRQSAESYAKLHREGFVGDLLAADKRREAIERERDLGAQEATVQSLDAAIAQAQARITQLRSQFRSQLLAERVEAQSALLRLEQDATRAGFRAQALEVQAPQTGIVQGLSTHTPGAVVQAGAALLDIVPKGDTLRAEALLANEDIGFVEVGQVVKVKLAAYPFQKYGLLTGRVVQLSADAVEPEQAARAAGSAYAVPPLAFKALVELDAQSGVAGRLALAPGMALTAEIQQGRRTVMEYLLSPVQQVSMEAGRER
jgi:HlyD family secretion protein